MPQMTPPAWVCYHARDGRERAWRSRRIDGTVKYVGNDFVEA
jgi:hypothetical protein